MIKMIFDYKKLASIFFFLTVLIACGGDDEPDTVTGCTDDRAENFNPNATNDDNSCIFPNEKFFGSYEGSFNCGALFASINQESVTFDITPPADDNEKNKVTVSANIAGIPLSLEGDVNGNDLIFVDRELTDITIANPTGGDDVLVDITFSGTATIDGDLLTADLTISTVLIIPLSENCTFSGMKQ